MTRTLKSSFRVGLLATGAVLAAMSGGAPRVWADTDSELVKLDPLTVTTATRTVRTLETVPVRTELLLREDIARRGAGDFSQAVELLNGVRVESNCQNCNTTEVQLLGLPGGYNRILFDGAPLLSVLGSVYGLEQVPAAFIDRIEVVKGGGSALYGPGAVAGVINLVPARPRQAGGYAAGTLEWQRGVALRGAEARLDLLADRVPLAVSVVGQSAANAPIDFDGDGYSEITRKRRQVAGLQSWWEPGDRTRVTANYQLTREARRGGNRFDQPAWLANVAEELDTTFHRGGWAWVHEPTPETNVRVAYGFAHIARASFYGGLGDVPTDPADPDFDPAELDPLVPGSAASVSFRQYGRTRNPLHFGEVQVDRRYGDHLLTFGAQYHRESVRDENRDFTGRFLSLLIDETFSSRGFFVQDEWTPRPHWDVVAGLRWDRSSVLDAGILSPRLALRHAPRPQLTLRGALATGYRAPEVFSEDLHVDTLGAEPIGIRNDPDLREERSITYSAGVEWRPAKLDGALVVDLTAALTRLRDTFVLSEVQTDPSHGGLFQLRENAEGSSVRSVEVGTAWRLSDHWRVESGLSYQRSRYDEAQVVFDDTDEGGETVVASARYLKSPDWTGTAQAIWAPNPRWDIFGALKLTGPMEVLNQRTGTLTRTPVFAVVDLGVQRHLDWGSRHFDVAVGVRNLFDQRQRDLETGPERDSDYVYGPRFARSVYVRANLRF